MFLSNAHITIQNKILEWAKMTQYDKLGMSENLEEKFARVDLEDWALSSSRILSKLAQRQKQARLWYWSSPLSSLMFLKIIQLNFTCIAA